MNELLKNHIRKITPVNDDEFDAISTYFTAQRFKKHQFLVQTGKPAPYEFFVTKGLLKSEVTDSSGKTHILQFAYEEWWISDMQAFNSGEPASLDIDCLENTEVLSITYDAKERLCANFRCMEYFFRKKSNAGNIALQKRVLMLMQASAAERYEQLIHQYPQMHARISKKLIAACLGITRETLSRLSNS
ncbi:Crp/Fnr family transcriptional regulator [Mucilaginibacter agri]|uniref:Cyclic nucleotide-binding domain-containing protein n=1 Tax=Mucilaginibacter agri TaxID=2695265 RepID=A0A966DV46_9SPHI|nr:Crp/Fnr family transcriptional regulator [Mucilaginibacter agri]NCD71111.1 cyclic nucleotide-binding domain-containing protein [Mucilaginibacter agri]